MTIGLEAAKTLLAELKDMYERVDEVRQLEVRRQLRSAVRRAMHSSGNGRARPAKSIYASAEAANGGKQLAS